MKSKTDLMNRRFYLDCAIVHYEVDRTLACYTKHVHFHLQLDKSGKP
jgi:hypothetical protein